MRRILQISDVHFGPPLVPTTLCGVFDLVEQRRPDLIVVAGDLTQRAKPWQFAQAREFVDALERHAPTLTVPGNHDVPLYRVWERVFDPYGAYRRHFAADVEPTFEDDELLVVGMNTAYGWTTSHGRLTRRSIRQAVERLEASGDERNVCRIAVAHHPLIRPAAFHGQRPVRRARKAALALCEAKVEILLSGHVHHFHKDDLSEAVVETGSEVLVLHSGTATSNRGRPPENGCNTCNFLEIDAEEIRFDRLGWNGPEARFVVEASFRRARRVGALGESRRRPEVE